MTESVPPAARRPPADRRKGPPTAVPIDPAALPEIYGLNVNGDCLAPEVPDGSVVACSRTAQYSTGDVVILWAKPELLMPGQAQCAVKRLVMGPPPGITFPCTEHSETEVQAVILVEMNNPPKTMAIRCSTLAAVHKCLGPVPIEQTREVTAEERATVAISAGKGRR